MASNYDQIRQDNIRNYGEKTHHLAFLGRLYSDRTHFVYELLQNAEDAGATQIRFVLHKSHLDFLHNGKLFDEADVRGICGVGEGTKPDDLNKIGKFGIGFKSVYAYTSSPEIHCGDEHFWIEHYVRPHGLARIQLPAPWTTKFVFPLDATAVQSDEAYKEIEGRLVSLNVRTLLFLRNIDEISWETESNKSGIYIRNTNRRDSGRQVTVIGNSRDSGDQEESWLIFDRPVTAPDGTKIRPVEIAFKLQKNAEDKSNKGERIVPLEQSPLFVFFATEKETRLGFLAQGPFITTPARDNIPKDEIWNTSLLEEMATLVVDSLRHLKSMNYLDASLLETMPIRETDFPQGGMLRAIYDAVVKVLTNEELLPVENGGFISARMAKIGRGADTRKLLSSAQLADLFSDTSLSSYSGLKNVSWLSGAITPDRTPALRSYLMEVLKIEEITPESFAKHVTDEFLSRQPDEWLVKLYKYLLKHEALWRKARGPWMSDGPIRNKAFVRLEDGTQVGAFTDDGTPSVYLPHNGTRGMPTIKKVLLEDNEVCEFFDRIGVRKPDVVSEVLEHVIPLYEPDEVEISPVVHSEHVLLIQQALKVDSVGRRKMLVDKLKTTRFLYARNVHAEELVRKQPADVYIRSKDLEVFLDGNPDAWVLDEQYTEEQLKAFVHVGVCEGLQIICRKANKQGFVIISREHGHHRRGIDGFDPECWVKDLDYALENPTKERSLLIWKDIARPLQRQFQGTVERATRQSYDNSKKTDTMSKLGTALRGTAWLPDQQGQFHRPQELSLSDLPREFERHEGLAGQLGMKGSELMNLAQKAGLEIEDLDLLKELKRMPEEFQQFKRLIEKRKHQPTFPERPSADPERRLKRARAHAIEAPNKQFEERTRSVRVSGTNTDKVTYLLESYTNNEDQLICQMCEREMPFRRRDGNYYFESVQLFDNLIRESSEAHVALCPLCAAKFKEFIKRDDHQNQRLKDQVINGQGGRFLLKLGDETGSIRFVEKHILDIQGLLAEEGELSNKERTSN